MPCADTLDSGGGRGPNAGMERTGAPARFPRRQRPLASLAATNSLSARRLRMAAVQALIHRGPGVVRQGTERRRNNQGHSGT